MRICVFCGSALGREAVYAAAAAELGRLMAEQKIALVYGGGNIGLMGTVADSVLAYGGQAIGVIPHFLAAREVAHQHLTELIMTDSMHERKRRMADLADAFIAMPGGWGTLEELAEILTWKQLGLIDAPVGVLNTQGFFDPLLAQMRHMVGSGFLADANLHGLAVEAHPAALLARMR
ncbi:MAG: TIGR00730 family Rossman fold protein [Cyclobacteriaceae bacterium]|jgi:hypothetical protein|nr:TIGR00730 family Rossman fold protein [Cyclobacteriaceae bacterium]